MNYVDGFTNYQDFLLYYYYGYEVYIFVYASSDDDDNSKAFYLSKKETKKL